MEMLKNYGTKENPKDRALETMAAKVILTAAKKICLRYTKCSQRCPYHRDEICSCMLQSTNVRRPDVWDLPWEHNLLPAEQALLLEIDFEPEASLVLSSIRNLSLEEREKYRIWRC